MKGRNELLAGFSSNAPSLSSFRPHPSSLLLFRHSKVHPNLPRAVALMFPDGDVLSSETNHVFAFWLDLAGVIAGLPRQIVHQPNFQSRDRKVQRRPVRLEPLREAI